MKLTEYQEFLEYADKYFRQIRAKHSSSFQCRKGCTGCCEPDLSVLTIEATNITRYLLAHPELIVELERLEAEDPHHGSRCSFLKRDGGCGIYPVRPFVCRSHGAPIAIAREEYYQIDVCPLNFLNNPIEELEQEDFFILDQWNEELLAYHNSEDRIALRLSSLIKTATHE